MIRRIAYSPASVGVAPDRNCSTAKKDGKNRIMTSPSPVETAAPT